ncbi:hypothetical protein JTE90_007612, partial [Oedothorax gibbosus]
VKYFKPIIAMTLADASNDLKLDSAPTDLISAVHFGPTSNQYLLASSWDKGVRLYDVPNDTLRVTYWHESPVLDCCFQDVVHCLSGDLYGKLKIFDVNSSTERVVGSHEKAIKCVEYCPDHRCVITGSWDKHVKLWDTRSDLCVGKYQMPDKVFTMATCGDFLVVGTAGKRVLVYDLTNMSYVNQRRESSLKFQTRCIRCFPNKQGYVLSSIEGRVAVEYFDPSPEVQKKKYAFKCHRIKEMNVELVYPVNCIAFHSGYNTFATGGSDGYVNVWDGFNKKRLCQFHRYPTHISSLAFSPDGTQIAIASSFIYEQERNDKPPDAIYVKTVTDQESKPK